MTSTRTLQVSNRTRWTLALVACIWCTLVCMHLHGTLLVTWFVAHFFCPVDDRQRRETIAVAHGLFVEQPRNAYVVARWCVRRVWRRVMS